MNSTSTFAHNCVACILSVIIPVIALIGTFLSGSILLLDYVHVLIGAVWIGIDVFSGLFFSSVLRTIDAVLKGVSEEELFR